MRLHCKDNEKKTQVSSCHFKTYHTGLILCLYIGDCVNITQGCNQQISSTATLYFKNKIRHPKTICAHRKRNPMGLRLSGDVDKRNERMNALCLGVCMSLGHLSPGEGGTWSHFHDWIDKIGSHFQ